MSINYFLLIPSVIALDLLLGEPKRFHPLVGFGSVVDKIEVLLHRAKHGIMQFFTGALAWLLLVIPLVVLAYYLEQQLGWGFSLLVAYLAIGANSLKIHALQIFVALKQNNLPQAREKVAYIVSRDTSQLSEPEISRASVESVLENGSDAIFAPLFWLVIGGAPAVVLYRLSNTLDAMWGYRNAKYEYFGKFSARMDDILNWIPARLTALSYVAMGQSLKAWLCWQRQARTWYSSNAGTVMSSGAGALDVQLGGTARYHGKDKSRPLLGTERLATADDIEAAWNLVFRSLLLWAILATLIGVI
jgi:adenosylcobinamide-phosphate synthase